MPVDANPRPVTAVVLPITSVYAMVLAGVVVLVSVRDNPPADGAIVTPVVPLVHLYSKLAWVALAGPAVDGSMAPKFKVDVVALNVHFDVTEALTVSVFDPAAAAMPEMQVKTAIAVTLKVAEVNFVIIVITVVGTKRSHLNVSIHQAQVKHPRESISWRN